MLEKKISLIMEGQTENLGDVDLDNFIKELEQLKKIISNLDEKVSNGKKTSRLTVVDLSHSSPATIALEIRPLKPFEDLSSIIFKKFHDLIKKVESRDEAEEEDFSTLRELLKLFLPIGKTMKSVIIGLNEERVPLSQDMEKYLTEIIADNEWEYLTCVEGMLEEINVHKDKNRFKIFLGRGYDGSVDCRFQEDKFREATQALKKRVSVKGIGKFKKGSIFPYSMGVEEIIVFPPAKDLPPLQEITGMFPNATGDLPVEDFLNKIREEWGRE